MNTQPLIIKLGGSLYNTDELSLWLKAAQAYSKVQPIIIVPGGGPFADQVRSAQTQHHFNDQTAHHMALLAMKQFGLLLMGLPPYCQEFNPDNDLAPLSVWLPDDSLLNESSIEQNWTISSDSLALWLAGQVNAQQLLLVKRVDTDCCSIRQLTDDKVLDLGFSAIFQHSAISCTVIFHQHYQQLAQIIANKPKLSLS